MAVVWRFEYTGESGSETIEFDKKEAASLEIRDNVALDVQRYKSGLVRIYLGPSNYKSGAFVFRQISGTAAKIRTLSRITTTIKCFYRYHRDQSLYLNIAIVPKRTERIVAGWTAADDLTLDFVEVEVDSVLPGLLYFPNGGSLYGCLV